MSDDTVHIIDNSGIKIDLMVPACMALLNKDFITMKRMTERIPETEEEITELTEKLADSKAKLEWLKTFDETKIKEYRKNYDDKVKFVIAKFREEGRNDDADFLSRGLDDYDSSTSTKIEDDDDDE